MAFFSFNSGINYLWDFSFFLLFLLFVNLFFYSFYYLFSTQDVESLKGELAAEKNGSENSPKKMPQTNGLLSDIDFVNENNEMNKKSVPN